MNEIAIVKYSTQELISMAELFAKSGMFQDTKETAQAFVKIKAGEEIGIGPFASMTGINMIKGKLSLSANLFAAQVKGSGKYDYKVMQQDDKKCSIDFYQGKELIGNSTFTVEDARRANTANLDKYPRNMLFARAISNGVKWYCPDVFKKIAPYGPGELDDVPDEPSSKKEIHKIEIVEAKEEKKDWGDLKPEAEIIPNKSLDEIFGEDDIPEFNTNIFMPPTIMAAHSEILGKYYGKKIDELDLDSTKELYNELTSLESKAKKEESKITLANLKSQVKKNLENHA